MHCRFQFLKWTLFFSAVVGAHEDEAKRICMHTLTTSQPAIEERETANVR